MADYPDMRADLVEFITEHIVSVERYETTIRPTWFGHTRDVTPETRYKVFVQIPEGHRRGNDKEMYEQVRSWVFSPSRFRELVNIGELSGVVPVNADMAMSYESFIPMLRIQLSVEDVGDLRHRPPKVKKRKENHFEDNLFEI